MIYRSNLTCPDLTRHFKHLVSRPMGHSFGHDVPSDWADKADDDPVFGIYKNCGLWTHDEAAILFNVARRLYFEDRRHWVDIGAHTGWTTVHLTLGAHYWGYPVEPMHQIEEFRQRFCDNHRWKSDQWCGADMYSDAYFAEKSNSGTFADGFVIDGCHEPGQPLRDAQNSAKHLREPGVIMLHDGTGQPVREAVQWLMALGFKARAYFTPHLVFCCWRGDFAPPDHEPDPIVKAAHLDGRYPDFDFERCV